MTRRGAGFGFCAIAAFLFASRCICIGLALIGNRGDYDTFGSELSIAAVVSLLVGIVYMIWGEITSGSQGKSWTEQHRRP